MSRESKIMRMDWRSLGYWPVYKDNRLIWEKDEKMSEKQEAQIIKFPQAEVSDEDFQVFMDALFGPYKGGGYLAE